MELHAVENKTLKKGEWGIEGWSAKKDDADKRAEPCMCIFLYGE